MAKGESLAYSILMANILRGELRFARLVIAYDIWCRIKCREDLDVDSGFVPVMHATNHVKSCQISANPNRMLMIGNEGGEDSERCWAFFRFLATLCSVMRNENREDLISLAVEAYNENKLFGMLHFFEDDFKSCIKTLKSLLNDLYVSSPSSSPTSDIVTENIGVTSTFVETLSFSRGARLINTYNDTINALAQANSVVVPSDENCSLETATTKEMFFEAMKPLLRQHNHLKLRMRKRGNKTLEFATNL